jgi:multicomponent Na+:H+ antiporter subunit E
VKRHAVLVVVFTLVWLALTGWFTPANVLLGLAVGVVVTGLVGGRGGRMAMPRPLKLIWLLGLFLVELWRSAVRVARLAFSPRLALKPAIIAFPLTVESDAEITLLANMITLTPGTLSVDVSADRRVLYVHCVDTADIDAEIAAIRSGFEQRILEAFR